VESRHAGAIVDSGRRDLGSDWFLGAGSAGSSGERLLSKFELPSLRRRDLSRATTYETCILFPSASFCRHGLDPSFQKGCCEAAEDGPLDSAGIASIAHPAKEQAHGVSHPAEQASSSAAPGECDGSGGSRTPLNGVVVFRGLSMVSAATLLVRRLDSLLNFGSQRILRSVRSHRLRLGYGRLFVHPWPAAVSEGVGQYCDCQDHQDDVEHFLNRLHGEFRNELMAISTAGPGK